MHLGAKSLVVVLLLCTQHRSAECQAECVECDQVGEDCVACADLPVDSNGIRWYGNCNWQPCLNALGNPCNEGRPDRQCPALGSDVACNNACVNKEHLEGRCFDDNICRCHVTVPDNMACNAFCTENCWFSGSCEPAENFENAVEGNAFVCVCKNEESENCCFGDPGYITSGGTHFESHVLFKHVLLQTRKGPKLNTDKAVMAPGSTCGGKKGNTRQKRQASQSLAAKIPDFTVYNINQCGQWLNGECQFANPWVAEFHIYGQVFNISFNGIHFEDDFFISISVNGGPPQYQWEYKGKNGEYLLFEPRDSSLMKADLKTNFGLRFFWSIGKVVGDNRWMHGYVPRTPSFTGTLEGVWGVFDNDNDTTNDLRLPDGTVFTGTDYDQFVQSWHADSAQRSKKVKNTTRRHAKIRPRNGQKKYAQGCCTQTVAPSQSVSNHPIVQRRSTT